MELRLLTRNCSSDIFTGWQVPLDEPACGFDGLKCSKLVQTIVGIVAAVALIGLIAAAIVYRYWWGEICSFECQKFQASRSIVLDDLADRRETNSDG